MKSSVSKYHHYLASYYQKQSHCLDETGEEKPNIRKLAEKLSLWLDIKMT